MADLYVYSGGSNTAPYDTWAKAATSLPTAVNAAAAGDNVWVAHDHAETGTAAITLTSPGTVTSPLRVICALRTGSTPPVAADIRATAVVQTANAASITFSSVASGCVYYEGIIFQTGSGSTGGSSININPAQNTRQVFKNCTLDLNNSSASAILDIGAGGATSWDVLWDNVKVEFGAVGQYIRLSNGRLRWVNTATALSGTVPTNVFNPISTTRTFVLEVEGVDLSGKSSGNIFAAASAGQIHATLLDCEFHGSATLSADQTIPGNEIVAARSAATGINYTLQRYAQNGNQQAQTTVVRTGGAAGPDSTAIGWQITTGSACKVLAPFDLIPIAVWNSTTGSSVTATIHGIFDAAAVPTDAEIWAEFYYLTGSGDPRAAIASTAPATILTTPANLTATTETWDSGVTLRAQNASYSVVGVPVKNSTAPGKVFFVKTTGTSANTTEPDWSAVADGADVTDGTVVFRAGCRFKLSTSFTPNLVGPVRAKLFVSKASVDRMYVDPKIVLS